jgi:hypothetical protein
MKGVDVIMSHEDNFTLNPTAHEVNRLIKQFQEEFTQKTSDTDKFLTINELESMWKELRNSTEILYSDMIRSLISEINERDMVRKKKRVCHQRNSFTKRQAT